MSYLSTPKFDLKGQKFGLLKVIKQVPFTNKGKGTMYKCKCECGNVCIKTSSQLRRTTEPARSCGCNSRKMWKNVEISHKRDTLKTINEKIKKANGKRIRCVKRHKTLRNGDMRCNKNHKWVTRYYSYYTKRSCPICMPKGYSKVSIKWLREIEKLYGIKINHAENGGEYTVKGFSNKRKWFKCDGYDPITKTVYEFDGDGIHGNPEKFKLNDRPSAFSFETTKELYRKSIKKKKLLCKLGYNVISVWASDYQFGHLYTFVMRGNKNKMPFRKTF